MSKFVYTAGDGAEKFYSSKERKIKNRKRNRMRTVNAGKGKGQGAEKKVDGK